MRPRGYWGLPAFASLSMAGSERGLPVTAMTLIDLTTLDLAIGLVTTLGANKSIWPPQMKQRRVTLLFCTILFEKFRQTETFLKLDDILCHVRHLTKTLILCMFCYSPISVCVAEYRG